MNTQQMNGNWTILKGKIKEKWGQLTDDDLTEKEGQLEQVAGRIAVRYGIAKEEASRQLKELQQNCGCK